MAEQRPAAREPEALGRDLAVGVAVGDVVLVRGEVRAHEGQRSRQVVEAHGHGALGGGGEISVRSQNLPKSTSIKSGNTY